ncbi:MAG: hypothetical protein KJ621_18485 [Proteobacteria bacterium]|nr:hypothetical protein [Pseudomonadota bacterium]MBU1740165.1 hypothetical protein [Pseudomonadota bacterium]
MGFLTRLLGIMPKQDRAGLSLGDDVGWEVTCPPDPAAFFEALGTLAPPDAVLAVQDPMGQAVRRFLTDRAAAQKTRVQAGTIWPRPTFFHVECSPDNLKGLADLARRHSYPEMGIHLHVYQDNRVILEWYDAFDTMMDISKTVDEELVRKFCRACGSSYRRTN